MGGDHKVVIPAADALARIERKKKKLPDESVLEEDVPEALNLVYKGRKILANDIPARSTGPSYNALIPKMQKLDLSFASKTKEIESTWMTNSNPFITIAAKSNFSEGKEFQMGAKFASSIETTWGNWIEEIIPLFNRSIHQVHAGNYDYVLREIVYDVKSGPNSMNKAQVESAKRKRNVIRKLYTEKGFEDIIYVRDFKIALCYGKKSTARMFMRDDTGLITFAADSWKELTGDEWNACRLFLWQLRYGIEVKKNVYDRGMTNAAIRHFIEACYETVDFENKLEAIRRLDEFEELDSILVG